MTSLLEGQNGASEYMLSSRVPATGSEEIYVAERVAPPELRGPVIVKHAKRSRASFAVLKERLTDEALENASFVHPNLTAVVDMIENDSGMYLIFENVAGTDLYEINSTLRRREQALSFELAAYIGFEMLKGIHHLHTARGPSGERMSIMIRDITPASVLVSSHGKVKIANRGLAALLLHTRRLTQAELVAYYAPERIAGEPFSIRSDIYSLGVMLFELLLGRPCFSANSKEEVLLQIVEHGVPVEELKRVGVPPRLFSIVERATYFVPEHRYNSAVDMARELEGWLYDEAPKEMARVASRFITLHDISKAPAQNLDKDGQGIPLAGSPLYPNESPGESPRAQTSNALVPASKIPALDLLSPADLEALADRPEFAALFGARKPSQAECSFFLSIAKDGITEAEARAIATRSVPKSAPGASGSGAAAAAAQAAQAAAQAAQAAQAKAAEAARAAQAKAAPPAPGPALNIVLEKKRKPVPPAQSAVPKKMPRGQWWRETLLIALIVLAVLALSAAATWIDHDVITGFGK